jgi:hypothetical protein
MTTTPADQIAVPDEVQREALAAIADDQPIFAVKIVRNGAGCTLRAARDWVAARTTGWPAATPVEPGWQQADQQSFVLPKYQQRMAERARVADALSMPQGTAVEPTTPQEVLDLLTAQKQAAGDQPSYEQLRAERDRLAAQVRQVRDIHRPATTEVGLPPSAAPRCVVCKVTAPCATVTALDGGVS